jgi:ElaB/YqjD/DUF883 family membrane-anchored ribosome-binding protein
MQPKSGIGKKIQAIAQSAERTSQKAGAAAGEKLERAKSAAGKKVAAAKKGWKEMDPKTKKKVVAGGIVAVAAAIAIPLAIKKARAKKK